MNFRLGLTLILIVAEFLTSSVFYSLYPLGPVCSPYPTKWSYINGHFFVVAIIWALIWMVTSFFLDPMFWQLTGRASAMLQPLFYAGLVGLFIDGGSSTYQRWTTAVSDETVHTWTRWGLIVNAGERTLLWMAIYVVLAFAMVRWSKYRESTTLDF